MEHAPHPPRLTVAVDAVDHVQGPAHEGVVLIEYGDFECPACASAWAEVKALRERHPQQLRFVFRHRPSMSAHPHAMLAAEAAEAAGAQGSFWPMHDLLFAHPHHLEIADLHRHAQALTLDLARFDAELADHVYLQRVQEHLASATACHVRTTPCFFVDGTWVDTAAGLQPLLTTVGARLQRAG